MPPRRLFGFTLTLLAALALSFPGSAPARSDDTVTDDVRPAIAIMRFSNVSESEWWLAQGERAARDVFAAHLKGVDGYRVVPRRELDQRMADEGILFRGEMSPATAIKFGRIFDIDYFVTGELTEFGASSPGFVKRSMGVLPGVKTDQRVFAATVSVRLVDARNGLTLWADEVRGQEVVSKEQAIALNDPVENHGRAFNRTVRPLFHNLASRMASDRETARALEAGSTASDSGDQP